MNGTIVDNILIVQLDWIIFIGSVRIDPTGFIKEVEENSQKMPLPATDLSAETVTCPFPA